jgi:predicted RND superfamily exporter protein/CRP-like cAMP-binding protein
MKRLLLGVVDHPILTIVLVLGITAVFAAALPRLVVDTSAEGLMVKGDPARAFYDSAKKRFGNDTLSIVVIKADDVFAAPVLESLRRVTGALERMDLVSRVESLTTVRNVKGDGQSLDTEPLVPRTVPTAADALAGLRADALRNPVLVGHLVAKDARATAVIAYLGDRPLGEAVSRRFTADIERVIAAETRPGVTLYQLGKPMVEVTLADYIVADQRTLIPLSGAVLLLVLLIAFRTPQGVVVPMTTALLSIVWTAGAMALLDLPLNALTTAVPSLLLAVGFAEDVHMISEYHERLRHGEDKRAALRGMLEDSGLPILVTTGTTVLGFLGLATTSITLLVQFGFAAALGLTMNFVVTLLVLPVMLHWWPVPRVARRAAFAEESGHGAIPRLMERLAAFIVARRSVIVVVAALFLVGSLWGWRSLRVDTDWVSYFPEQSALRQRMADLHRSLSGGLVLYVVVDTGRPDGVKDPAVLRKIAGIQEFLRSTGRVDATVSLADHVKLMHREMNGGAAAFAAVPDSAEEIAQYLLLLDTQDTAKLVSFDGASANVLVRHNLSSSWELAALLRDLDAHVARDVPRSISVRATGEDVLVNRAADILAVNELMSFGTTLLIIGLIHALLFTSLRAGFLSLVPNVVPIVYNFGVMGLVGIPLNVGTAIVGSIAIGIAVDDTVHHMIHYSRELKRHHNQRRAMVDTLRSQGRPVIYVSVALAAGFLVLGFSSFVPTRQAGLLCGLIMLVAMVGELTLTPLLMYSTQLVTLWDLVRLRMNAQALLRAPLFRDLSRWEIRKVVVLGDLRPIAAGHAIVTKGDRGNEMFVVVSGQARVFDVLPDGTERTLTTLRDGDLFGEIALVGGGVRTASVVAEAPTEVLALDFRALERIRRRFPYTGSKIFRNLARNLADRLRDQPTAATA